MRAQHNSHSHSRAAWLYYARCYTQQKQSLVVTLAMCAIQFVFVLPTIYLVRHVFDVVIPRGDLRGVFWDGLAITAFQVSSTIFSLWVRTITLNTTKAVVSNIRFDLISRLYKLSRNFFGDAERGALHTTIVQDTERVDIMSNALVSRLIPSLVASAALFAALIWVSWRLFLALLIVAPLPFLVERIMRRKLKASSRDFRRSFEDFSKGVLFVADSIDLTRAQTAEKDELERQLRHIDELHRTSARFAWFDTAYSQIQSNLTTLASVVVLMVGGVAIAHKSMTIGDLLSFFVALRMFNQYGSQIVQIAPVVALGHQSLLALYGLLCSEEVEPYKGTARIDFRGGIKLDRVHFSYGGTPILNGITLTIRPRTTVTIVGPNGSGKTTILHLILGFYRPQVGTLYCDTRAYDEVDLSCVRGAIGFVPQNPLFFSGSIRENISYGVPEASLEQIRQSANLALADEFIAKLPHGYETNIGDDGICLAGGQRQRIAIARALLRRPKLLVLDEPTNHLDIAAITQLMENLRRLEGELALLVISHNHDVIKHADEVYEIENGVATYQRASALKETLLHGADS